jgi:hypothetical protein
MGAVKDALLAREERAQRVMPKVQATIDAVREVLENDRKSVLSAADLRHWRKCYNLLDDFEQAVADFYCPMLQSEEEQEFGSHCESALVIANGFPTGNH